MSVHLKKRPIVVRGGRNRKPRPKTFSSEESAKAHAVKMGIKDYALENIKCDSNSKKKIRIVQK